VLIALAGAIHAARRLTKLPRVLTALSRESLLVYLGHVMLLYGSVWTVGLAQSLGPRYGPAATMLWIALLLTLVSLSAWVWHECKRHTAVVAVLVRVSIAAAVVYAVV
jgi:Na+/melibiose symporter-like transporter